NNNSIEHSSADRARGKPTRVGTSGIPGMYCGFVTQLLVGGLNRISTAFTMLLLCLQACDEDLVGVLVRFQPTDHREKIKNTATPSAIAEHTTEIPQNKRARLSFASPFDAACSSAAIVV